LLFYRHPDSHPSYINDYFAGIMDRSPKDGTWVFANDTNISPVQFVQAPYTPWSDNHTWSAYGVPSPLIMSWPDLYFHTQLLSADNTDPRVFRRAGITTALAAYEIANAGPREARSIADEVTARSRFRLDELAIRAIRKMSDATQAGEDASGVAKRTTKQLSYYVDRDMQNIASTLSLVSGDALDALEDHVRSQMESVAAHGSRAIEQVNAALASMEQEGNA
jgi:hypothetical protein